MEYQSAPTSNRVHPLMLGAAASVVLVSLLGAAAIAGILPASHGIASPEAHQVATTAAISDGVQTVTPVSGSRFVTADGRVLEVVKTAAPASQSDATATPALSKTDRATHVHRKPIVHAVRHQQVALNESRPYRDSSYRDPSYRAPTYRAPTYQDPSYQTSASQYPVTQVAQTQPSTVYAPQPQPVSAYGNVNPVQTGVGAVIGGLLGSQIGKGNGRTLATVAGVIAGGYAGNEISHGRSPIPTW